MRSTPILECVSPGAVGSQRQWGIWAHAEPAHCTPNTRARARSHTHTRTHTHTHRYTLRERVSVENLCTSVRFSRTIYTDTLHYSKLSSRDDPHYKGYIIIKPFNFTDYTQVYFTPYCRGGKDRGRGKERERESFSAPTGRGPVGLVMVTRVNKLWDNF